MRTCCFHITFHRGCGICCHSCLCKLWPASWWGHSRGFVPYWGSWRGPDLWPRPRPCSQPASFQMSAPPLGPRGGGWVREKPLWPFTNKSVRVSLAGQPQRLLHQEWHLRCGAVTPAVWWAPNKQQDAVRWRALGLAAEVYPIIE